MNHVGFQLAYRLRILNVENENHILLIAPSLWPSKKMELGATVVNESFHLNDEVMPSGLGQLVVTITNLQTHSLHCSSPGGGLCVSSAADPFPLAWRTFRAARTLRLQNGLGKQIGHQTQTAAPHNVRCDH